jgi:pheromone shutdown protein TraB
MLREERLNRNQWILLMPLQANTCFLGLVLMRARKYACRDFDTVRNDMQRTAAFTKQMYTTCVRKREG